ncbi:MAG TPA: PrsW family glutamic-type intramembrane protease [Isosphaeraceae bacterium]|nr:PrsW family glutamic-type intramembrane protease [Isosphaeraceae bacterium]
MAIVFACECGRRLHAKDELAGRRTQCPGCGAIVKIPEPPAPAVDEPEDLYGLLDPAPPGRHGPEPEFEDDADEGEGTWSPAPTVSPRPATAAYAEEPEPASGREYLHWLLVLALIPLAFSLLGRDKSDLKERFDHTMEKAPDEVRAKVERLSREASLDDVLNALPDHKLDDEAHLARDSMRHWAYAVASALAFLALIALCLPRERVQVSHLFLVGLFTGTVGIVLLLGFQFAADMTQGVWVRGRGVGILIFYVVKFIGWSYQSALAPDSSLVLSLVGFTFGVGLCEECCKLIPLLAHYRRGGGMGWRGACLWGLASGVGFGVSEGIMYAGQHYNGVASAGIYVVRFVSCVALHAIWSGSAALTLQARQDELRGSEHWAEYMLRVVRVIAVPMVLHGMYDTLLKKDMNVAALVVGLASFAWFAWRIELARGNDDEAELAALNRRSRPSIA